MTQREIEKFLADTKVYVAGKSKEIQKKLFSFGYKWGDNSTEIRYMNEPFLYISSSLFYHGNNMIDFMDDERKEITAKEILSLEVTEPSYRPFNTKEECWQEMLKHEPFGWIKKINGGYKQIMAIHMDMFNKHCADFVGQTGTACFELEYIYKNYTFTDGTPFGIKEE